MKIILLIICCILASCRHVVEPMDVVVSQQANRLELGNNTASIDVTDKKVIKLQSNCCNK